MQVPIKLVKGGEVFYVDVEQSYTMREVKNKIEQKRGYLPDDQRLLLPGKGLLDHHTVSYYGISEKSSLHLALRFKKLIVSEVL